VKDKLIITKKGVKGEDGYKVFSIRIKDELVEKLDQLAQQTNRSRNDLINTLLDFAVEHSEVEDTGE
jgi:predicted transcriptional regulator